MIITIKEKINCRFYDAEYMIICKSEQSPLFFSFPTHCYVTVSEYDVFSTPYFPVFGLNTVICRANFRSLSKYRKLRSRKKSIFRIFSCSELPVRLTSTPAYFFAIRRRQKRGRATF